MNKFRVLCEVSGGVTGYRVAYLKNAGEEIIFPNRETAEAEAARLTTQANGPHKSADFRYTPEPLGGQS